MNIFVDERTVCNNMTTKCETQLLATAGTRTVYESKLLSQKRRYTDNDLPPVDWCSPT